MSTPRAILSLIAVVIIVPSLLLGVRAYHAATWLNDATLVVWVFDVGQGDAIFIDGPEKQVLIDGGPDTRVLEKLGAVLPPWDRTLDVVIATHPHADHVFGLNAVLERYDVTDVYGNGEVYDEAPAEAYALHETQTLVAPMTIDLGNGVRLDVVWPGTLLKGTLSDDPNDGSVVALLTYGETTMLLTGDAGVAEEEQFMYSLPKIDVLKVGHHGSDTSTGIGLVNLLQPDYALISLGESNDYGHPSSLVVRRLQTAGAEVFRTDLHGDIRVLTRGGEPQIRNSRE